MFALKSTSHLKLQLYHRALLNKLPAPIMLTNHHFTITFVNGASMDALKKIAPHLPVAIDKIVGSNIRIFYQNPMQLHNRTTQFMLGDIGLSMSATMLKNARGEFDGAFIDWDITANTTKEQPPIKNHQIMLPSGQLIALVRG